MRQQLLKHERLVWQAKLKVSPLARRFSTGGSLSKNMEFPFESLVPQDLFFKPPAKQEADSCGCPRPVFVADARALVNLGGLRA